QLSRLEAIAAQKPECIEQNRFAGAGLPGQHRKTAVELEVEHFDDDEIADRQEPEHGKVRRVIKPGSGSIFLRRSCAEIACTENRFRPPTILFAAQTLRRLAP